MNGIRGPLKESGIFSLPAPFSRPTKLSASAVGLLKMRETQEEKKIPGKNLQ